MIETGIARQLDAVGRITLPKELRKSLGFKDRELLEIYTEDDKIILISKESIRELSKLAGLI